LSGLPRALVMLLLGLVVRLISAAVPLTASQVSPVCLSVQKKYKKPEKMVLTTFRDAEVTGVPVFSSKRQRSNGRLRNMSAQGRHVFWLECGSQRRLVSRRPEETVG